MNAVDMRKEMSQFCVPVLAELMENELNNVLQVRYDASKTGIKIPVLILEGAVIHDIIQ